MANNEALRECLSPDYCHWSRYRTSTSDNGTHKWDNAQRHKSPCWRRVSFHLLQRFTHSLTVWLFSTTWTCVTRREALTAVCPVACHSSRLHLSVVLYHNVINMLAQLPPAIYRPEVLEMQSVPSSEWMSEKVKGTRTWSSAHSWLLQKLLAVESRRITIYLCSSNDIL